MFVYVLSKDGKPLMPTKKLGKVRHMLKDGRAKVVQRTPFTIQLTYETTGFTQEISLGVDAGNKVVGLSATTEKEELFASNVILRNDVVKLLADRKMYRMNRRGRKTRYRPQRISNRANAKTKGRLGPSVLQKINTHIQVIKNIHKILPIAKIIVEVASFNIHKMKKPDILGEEYLHGEQENFWNVREYVLFRDNHECQHCHGKSGDKILNVHHIESRKTGGNAPNNLITLCKTCHKAYHEGKVDLKAKRGESYRDAAFMGIMRWAFYDKLKEQYENVSMTFGYLTKSARIKNGLKKDHCVDARCISGNPKAKPLDCWFLQRAMRRRNRQLHKATILKGGYRKANQAPKYVFGYQLFDKVRMLDGREGFVFARRVNGSFKIRTLENEKLSEGTIYKKLTPLEKRRTILTERRIRYFFVDFENKEESNVNYLYGEQKNQF